MNPAFSVVLLTTVSGAGYGLLFWLGLLGAVGQLPHAASFGLVGVIAALALSTVGLLGSTSHLGHPERAWRAMSQWRSSWLSREGVMALATYVPAAGFMLAWLAGGAASGATVVLGLVAAAFGILTVVCQAMIYATLKPIRQWNNTYVVPNFLLLALFSGGACLAALAGFWDGAAGRAAGTLALIAALIAFAVKLSYWRFIDTARPAATINSATGLAAGGIVRALEAPHTEENYLLREMGYAIGRKHAEQLRRIVLVLGFAAPIVLLAAGLALGGTLGVVLMPLAAIAALIGIYVERWLFFAQATHTVTLFYGRA